jgi:hypothetical protein
MCYGRVDQDRAGVLAKSWRCGEIKLRSGFGAVHVPLKILGGIALAGSLGKELPANPLIDFDWLVIQL